MTTTDTARSPELNAALEQLRDIYVPAPETGFGISGDYSSWLVLGLLGLVLAWLIRRHVILSPRLIALKELNDIRRAHVNATTSRQTLVRASALIRRLALSLYPPEQVAGLTGELWLAFLDETSKSTFFIDGEGRVLGIGAFAETTPALEPDAFFIGVERWIRTAATPHRSWRDRLLRPAQGLPTLYPLLDAPSER